MSWLSDRLGTTGKRPLRAISDLTGSVARVALPVIGGLVAGPLGGAAGGALGQIADNALKGRNVRRTTTLRGTGGAAATGAVLGGAANAIRAGAGAASAAGGGVQGLKAFGRTAAGALNPFGGGGGTSEAQRLAQAADLSVPASQLVTPAASTIGGMRPLQAALLATQVGGNLYSGVQQGKLAEMQANALADDMDRRRRQNAITDPQYEAIMADLLNRTKSRAVVPIGPLAGGA
jgi:hypothetical protein